MGVLLGPRGLAVIVGQGNRSGLVLSGLLVLGTVRSLHRVQPHARGGYDTNHEHQ